MVRNGGTGNRDLDIAINVLVLNIEGNQIHLQHAS